MMLSDITDVGTEFELLLTAGSFRAGLGQVLSAAGDKACNLLGGFPVLHVPT